MAGAEFTIEIDINKQEKTQTCKPRRKSDRTSVAPVSFLPFLSLSPPFAAFLPEGTRTGSRKHNILVLIELLPRKPPSPSTRNAAKKGGVSDPKQKWDGGKGTRARGAITEKAPRKDTEEMKRKNLRQIFFV